MNPVRLQTVMAMSFWYWQNWIWHRCLVDPVFGDVFHDVLTYSKVSITTVHYSWVYANSLLCIVMSYRVRSWDGQLNRLPSILNTLNQLQPWISYPTPRLPLSLSTGVIWFHPYLRCVYWCSGKNSGQAVEWLESWQIL